MEKILEEIKKLEEFSERVNKNKEREVIINKHDEDLKMLYEKMQLKMIGSSDREMVKKEYEEKKSKLDKIHEVKKKVDSEIQSDFDNQKKQVTEQIDKEISKYLKTKQEKENAEKARDEKIKQLEKQKSAYMKIALNSKKDIDNILKKLNNGENVNSARLTDARQEYEANAKKNVEVKHQIEDIKKQQFKSIEENKDEFSDLMYLRARIVGMKIDDVEKIAEDDFLKKYDKEKQEKNENKAEEKKEDNNKKTKEKTEKKENKDKKLEEKAENKENKDKKTEEKVENKENNGKKPEEKVENNDKKTEKSKKMYRKNLISLDVSNNKININENQSLYYKQEEKNKKQLKLDSDLSIKSYFLNDKKKMKNIDYALLSILNKSNKALALEYLNVIRGGGIGRCGTAEESLAKIKSVVDFEYKFDKGTGIFTDLKAKRIARYAHKLGLAELDGISEKVFFDEMKDKFKNSKLFKTIEKPKKLTSGDEKTIAQLDKEKTIARIKEDRTTGANSRQTVFKDDIQANQTTKNNINNVSKKYEQTEKDATNEIGEDVKRIVTEANRKATPRVNPKDVEVIPPKNNGIER